MKKVTGYQPDQHKKLSESQKSNSQPVYTNDVLSLQRMVGNRAVIELLSNRRLPSIISRKFLPRLKNNTPVSLSILPQLSVRSTIQLERKDFEPYLGFDKIEYSVFEATGQELYRLIEDYSKGEGGVAELEKMEMLVKTIIKSEMYDFYQQGIDGLAQLIKTEKSQLAGDSDEKKDTASNTITAPKKPTNEELLPYLEQLEKMKMSGGGLVPTLRGGTSDLKPRDPETNKIHIKKGLLYDSTGYSKIHSDGIKTRYLLASGPNDESMLYGEQMVSGDFEMNNFDSIDTDEIKSRVFDADKNEAITQSFKIPDDDKVTGNKLSDENWGSHGVLEADIGNSVSNIIAAGDMIVDKGKLVTINNQSGMYKPDLDSLRNVVKFLIATGVVDIDDLVEKHSIIQQFIPNKSGEGGKLLDITVKDLLESEKLELQLF